MIILSTCGFTSFLLRVKQRLLLSCLIRRLIDNLSTSSSVFKYMCIGIFHTRHNSLYDMFLYFRIKWFCGNGIKRVVEGCLSFLLHSGVPTRLWSYACRIVIYLQNRLPTKVLNYSSPYTILYKRSPDICFWECLTI